MKNKHYQGQFLEHDQTYHQYKQACLQLSPQEQHHVKHDYGNLSVFTVENARTSKVNDSEPVYQTIDEISRKITQNIQGICERKGEKLCQYMNNDYHNKRNIVYGVITAKEMAKYRPYTPDIVRR